MVCTCSIQLSARTSQYQHPLNPRPPKNIFKAQLKKTVTTSSLNNDPNSHHQSFHNSTKPTSNFINCFKRPAPRNVQFNSKSRMTPHAPPSRQRSPPTLPTPASLVNSTSRDILNMTHSLVAICWHLNIAVICFCSRSGTRSTAHCCLSSEIFSLFLKLISTIVCLWDD